MHSSSITISGVASIVLTLAFGSSASAQCLVHEYAKLIPPFGTERDLFGSAVAVHGSRAVVGAFGDDSRGENAGSVFFYREEPLGSGGWRLDGKVNAEDSVERAHFGATVALLGDVALVGADHDDDNGTASGSVYVLRYDGTKWVEEAKLLANDGFPWARFGSALALGTDIALIGSWNDNEQGHDSGSAYVFLRDGKSNWLLERKILASDGMGEDRFAFSVALSTSTMAAGASHREDHGIAYAFDYVADKWEEVAQLPPPNHRRGAYFGRAVAITENTLVVGAPGAQDLGPRVGAVYVYHREGSEWLLSARLLPPDRVSGDQFGYSLAIEGDTLLVGAPYSGKPHGSGLVHVFQRQEGQWTPVATLAPSDPGEDDGFGKAIAMHGDYALIGAEDDDVQGSNSGAVYAFRGLQSDCNVNGVLDVVDLAACSATDCNRTGILDECEDVAHGDFDGDGDVQLDDYDAFFECWAGPAHGPNPADGWCDESCRRAFDFDADGDLDLEDFAALQALLRE